MAQVTLASESDRDQDAGIRAISVRGYKSLADNCRIEIRPLTILAGANSSGKSSIMQPVLLLKQTLEAGYDSGPLSLDGPHVKFRSVDQLFSRLQTDSADQSFCIEIETPIDVHHKITFARKTDQSLRIQDMVIDQINAQAGHRSLHLRPDQKSKDLENALSSFLPDFQYKPYIPPGFQLAVSRNRCFLSIILEPLEDSREDIGSLFFISPSIFVSSELHRMIHIPGLRSADDLVHSVMSSDRQFVGTFEKYVATTIADWHTTNDARLRHLTDMLSDLGLTKAVYAKRLNDTQIELFVGRLPTSDLGESDLVSIAHVGIGVSQVLPILIALLVAERGQIVYIEQPELHLHPRAQHRLARMMSETAKRGVKLVVETHSSLLLLQVQTLVAEGKLEPNLVKLYWFSRNPDDGKTIVSSANLDRDGAFGDWPEDFAEVELMAEGNYLNAVEVATEIDGETVSKIDS